MTVDGARAEIVVTGMAVRAPGAPDLASYWRLLTQGTCAIDGEGVAARGRIPNLELFDHTAFGYSQDEAAALDPQQRIGLEVSMHALEDAGALGSTQDARLGVYASVGYPSYRDVQMAAAERTGRVHELRRGCKEDFFASRLAIAFDAHGPTTLFGTACSSSLVALAAAVRDLRAGICDIALVCACSLGLSSDATQSVLRSSDGRCRPYDARGDGLVGADGAAAVVLRRASTLDQGAYARVLGVGVSNDGSGRMSFTSPSPRGQMLAVQSALTDAAIDPASIAYIEGHGSGTRLGDAIELEALGAVYGVPTRTTKASLGSVKSNIGHCDVAAGLIGFVKCVLVVHHRVVVPNAGFEHPTPLVDWEALPLRVQTRAEDWPESSSPRRAAVHSVGMGGTNAHVILEQMPEAATPERAEPSSVQTWCMSAPSASALETLSVRLISGLRAAPLSAHELASASRVLRFGRRPQRFRRAVVAATSEELVAELARCNQVTDTQGPQAIMHAFGGLGSIAGAHVRGLHASDVGSRIVATAERLLEEGGCSTCVGDVLLDEQHVAYQIALARSWIEARPRPGAVIGYSIGELAALAIADALPDIEAVRLARARREVLESAGITGDTMVAYAAAEDVRQVAEHGAFVSCELAPRITIVAGERAAVRQTAATLAASGVSIRPVTDGRAVHTPLAEPVLAAMANVAPTRMLPATTTIGLPAWNQVVDTGMSVDPRYLVAQLCAPLQWHAALDKLENHIGGVGVVLEMNAAPAVSGLGSPSTSYAPRLVAIPAPDTSFDRHHAVIDANLWMAGCDTREPIGAWHRTAAAVVPPSPFDRAACWLGEIATANVPVVTFAPARPRNDHHSARVATRRPSGTRDEDIARIFAEELGIAKVTPDDNFFSLGGRSITALNVVTRLRSELGARLTVADFLDAPVPRALAQLPASSDTAPARAGWLRDRLHSGTDPDGVRWEIQTHVRKLVESVAPDLAADWAKGSARDVPSAGPLLATLIDDLSHATGRRVFPHELLACNSLASIVELVATIIAPAEPARPVPRTRECHSDAEVVFEPLEDWQPAIQQRNPPAIFLLSSARSGSTLLRVMLAGHPDLFVPPELHLLPYADMSSRRDGLSSRHFGSGLARAWQELHMLPVEAADAEIASWEQDAISTQEAYRRVQEAAAPRMLVDKSPSNARSVAFLQNIDRMFRAAYIIYLHRHPLAVMESYVRNRLGSIGTSSNVPPWELAERHWFDANANICRYLGLFVESGGATRRPHLRVAFEDLVTDPEATMRAVCRALGIAFDVRVLDLIGEGRMRDGPGDPGFAARRHIDPSTASEWSVRTGDIQLSARALGLARRLGYPV